MPVTASRIIPRHNRSSRYTPQLRFVCGASIILETFPPERQNGTPTPAPGGWASGRARHSPNKWEDYSTDIQL
jgi:hypothetical protein